MTLPDAIDRTWQLLLEKCAAVDAEGKPVVRFDDQISALVSAAKWVEIKAKIAPPPAPPPDANKASRKFEGLKEKFHGKPRRKPVDESEIERGGIAPAPEADPHAPGPGAANGAATDYGLIHDG